MKKSDLKNKMIVECRNGNRYIVVGSILMCHSGFSDLANFNDDLKHIVLSEYDIMKVYDEIYSLWLLNAPKYWNLLWERTEVKEVTMAEVEEKFGCKVKIIKE